MFYAIGIDTGGTYTDAVIYDFDARAVIAKCKTPTTHHDLSLCIGNALDLLPADLLARCARVSLSTTLATNACVENKGGRARLVLMGTTLKTLHWIGAEQKYGLRDEDVLCLDTKGSFDGKIVDHPDWDAVMAENEAFFAQAQALSVAEMNAPRNGAVCEIAARDALKGRYSVPFVMASELVGDLNMMERGATALLNARLLPVIERFMHAVDQALKARGLTIPQLIVRSDGTLMTDSLARTRPVETILSGPAASVMGSKALSESGNCLIVDMGGTTTDISIIRSGTPKMTDGIRIGGWRTQIKGVFTDTFALGGDTRLVVRDGKLHLDTRRVEPLCAAAARWPQIITHLEELISQTRLHTRPLHEFLYLMNEPTNPERYTGAEQSLIDTLRDGPQMIGGSALNIYSLDSERLEREGVVMRCGLTPTDIMHLRGDYTGFDTRASELAARYFLRVLPYYKENAVSMDALCEEVYTLVKHRLFENVARVLLETTYPEICKGALDAQLQALIEHKWTHRDDPEDRSFFALPFDVNAALVGIGAPTHLFLPDVAKALGASCILPEHGAVANALGAVVAGIAAQVSVEVRPSNNPLNPDGYNMYAADLSQEYGSYAEALDAARDTASRLACEEARRRGALGELQIEFTSSDSATKTRYGDIINLGAVITATAREHNMN